MDYEGFTACRFVSWASHCRNTDRLVGSGTDFFVITGMGSHFIEAAIQRDYTLAMGGIIDLHRFAIHYEHIGRPCLFDYRSPSEAEISHHSCNKFSVVFNAFNFTITGNVNFRSQTERARKALCDSSGSPSGAGSFVVD